MRPFHRFLLGFALRLRTRTLQFFVSPHIGALSDKYGRKRILLITMIGNIASALMCVSSSPRRYKFKCFHCDRWIQSTTFASYILSRVVGGLSEGNVQLAMSVRVSHSLIFVAKVLLTSLEQFFRTCRPQKTAPKR